MIATTDKAHRVFHRLIGSHATYEWMLGAYLPDIPSLENDEDIIRNNIAQIRLAGLEEIANSIARELDSDPDIQGNVRTNTSRFSNKKLARLRPEGCKQFVMLLLMLDGGLHKGSEFLHTVLRRHIAQVNAWPNSGRIDGCCLHCYDAWSLLPVL